MVFNNFPSGLPENKQVLVREILHKLSPHIDINKVTLVGGLVVKFHLQKEGATLPDNRFNDIDLCISELAALRPSVMDDFLVWHYHPDHQDYYVVLLDPVTGIKLDIMNCRRSVLQTETVKVDDLEVKIRGLEDQFTELVLDCYRVVNIKGFKNKQHYFDDMTTLYEIVDLGLAQKLWDLKDKESYPFSPAWQSKKTAPYPHSIKDAYKESLEVARKHPDRVFVGNYSKQTPFTCEYCAAANGFEMSEMNKVLEIYNSNKAK